MQILTDLLVGFLSAYIAVTSSMATSIEDFLAQFEGGDSSTVTEEQVEEKGFASIPSLVDQTIPDILLKSADYQAAAVSDADDLSGGTTRDPLEAIVNVFCTFTTEDYIKTTTGTGFFVDPDGVIMTNAHVAQFLLLEETDEDGETECVVRAGDPATTQYQAELLYLPPAWIQENATVMNQEVPMGTGERDYALLYVTERVDDTPLPAMFPSLALDTSLLPLSTRGDSVLAAGYPAQPLLDGGSGADLVPQRATTTVTELYTFGSNYADVFSIQGSVVGAEGSSGGPVLNEAGEVIGMIVTRGDDEIDGAGSLRAITLSHIERTIEEETNFDLKQNFGGDLTRRANVFAETVSPFLLSILQNSN